MKSFTIYLIIVSALPALGKCECIRQDWRASFDWEGLSMCDQDRLINGFFRNNRATNDNLRLLEEAECCDMTSPWDWYAKQTMNANWQFTLDTNQKWASCPAGYFLEGLYRSENNPGWLRNIEEGRCTKPRDHPNYHSQCYDQDISQCFEDRNLCKCNDGYFVTGLYKGSCDALYCLDKLYCCKMAATPEIIDDASKVKTRIMDRTMSFMALLAHYLGYGWCAGCKALYVGEDFIRSGYTWQADASRRCSGYKSNQRLNMKYGDWSCRVKVMTFGDPVIEELIPDTVDSGVLYNNDTTEAVKTFSRSVTSVRTVRHTTTSSWKLTNEFNIEIEYSIARASYKFAYENSVTTEDSEGKEYTQTFQVTNSKTVAANSSVKWSFQIYNTRRTIPYTATILVRFSTELQGFLRFGGGYNGDSTNYHISHRGSGGRPTFNYRFGDANIPFYEALKEQSDTNSPPWMWNDMKNQYRDAQYVIDELCDEDSYVFTVSGQFEDVQGTHSEVIYEPAKRINKRSANLHKQEGDSEGVVKYLKKVARAGPGDVPAPRPPPPKVKVEVKKRPVSFPVASTGD